MIHDVVSGEMESFDPINRVLMKCMGEAVTECEKSVTRQFSEPWRGAFFVFGVIFRPGDVNDFGKDLQALEMESQCSVHFKANIQ